MDIVEAENNPAVVGAPGMHAAWETFDSSLVNWVRLPDGGAANLLGRGGTVTRCTLNAKVVGSNPTSLAKNMDL